MLGIPGLAPTIGVTLYLPARIPVKTLSISSRRLCIRSETRSWRRSLDELVLPPVCPNTDGLCHGFQGCINTAAQLGLVQDPFFACAHPPASHASPRIELFSHGHRTMPPGTSLH